MFHVDPREVQHLGDNRCNIINSLSVILICAPRALIREQLLSFRKVLDDSNMFIHALVDLSNLVELLKKQCYIIILKPFLISCGPTLCRSVKCLNK